MGAGMKGTGERILAYYYAHPDAAPAVREIVRDCDISSTSVVRYWQRKYVAQGVLETTGAPGTSRRYRLVNPQNLTSVVRLLLERTERRGGYGVVPWAAIEALREAVQG